MSRFNDTPVVRGRLFLQAKPYRKALIRDNLNPLNGLFPRQDYVRHYVNNLASWHVMKAKYRCFGIALNNAVKIDSAYEAMNILNTQENSLFVRTNMIDWLEVKFGDNFFSCNDCDKYYLSDDEYHNVGDDYGVCDCCVRHYRWSERSGYYVDRDSDNDDDNSDLIRSYHGSLEDLEHIPSAYDKRKILLGMELEIEIDGDNLRNKAEDILNNITDYWKDGKRYTYCLLENDGSLDYGFEMVTSWTGLDVHAEQLKYFNQKFRNMRSHNTNTCGLHVHIDKAEMTTLHASKLILFINDTNNLHLIKTIARRDNASFAKFKDKKADKSWLKHSLNSSSVKERQLRHLNVDRYEALNFQNERTIEFRLFKGSLVYSTIMACLEFTYASYFFTKDASINNLTTHKFLEFICLDDNKSDTKFLREYLVKKGFSLPTKPSKTIASINTSMLVTFE
jgi:hypothetical protein